MKESVMNKAEVTKLKDTLLHCLDEMDTLKFDVLGFELTVDVDLSELKFLQGETVAVYSDRGYIELKFSLRMRDNEAVAKYKKLLKQRAAQRRSEKKGVR